MTSRQNPGSCTALGGRHTPICAYGRAKGRRPKLPCRSLLVPRLQALIGLLLCADVSSCGWPSARVGLTQLYDGECAGSSGRTMVAWRERTAFVLVWIASPLKLVPPRAPEATFKWVLRPQDGAVHGTVYTDGSQFDGAGALGVGMDGHLR